MSLSPGNIKFGQKKEMANELRIREQCENRESQLLGWKIPEKL